MGDPQAPLERVMAVLDAHGLLSDEGTLAPDVSLVSLGDHFDWGGAAEALRAREDGLALLAWLLAHPSDQVALVAGNHDLGRLGELHAFDDASFQLAQREARVVYDSGDEGEERALLERWPALPTAELAARDFAAFSVAQRELVRAALASGRMRAAFALDAETLFIHAGVSLDDLAAHGISAADARVVAEALSRLLREALDACGQGPLRIEHLHEPGNAAIGEGGGIFFHRATLGPFATGPTRRRFDARRLPPGITQVVGHVVDEKTRELLADWTVGPPAEGRLRTLVATAESGTYQRGVHPRHDGAARVVFCDGAMKRTPPDRYGLLDARAMAELTPTRR